MFLGLSPKVERSEGVVKSRPFRFCPSVVVSVTASSFGSACVVCWPSVEWEGLCWDGRRMNDSARRQGLQRRQVRAC